MSKVKASGGTLKIKPMPKDTLIKIAKVANSKRGQKMWDDLMDELGWPRSPAPKIPQENN